MVNLASLLSIEFGIQAPFWCFTELNLVTVTPHNTQHNSSKLLFRPDRGPRLTDFVRNNCSSSNHPSGLIELCGGWRP